MPTIQIADKPTLDEINSKVSGALDFANPVFQFATTIPSGGQNYTVLDDSNNYYLFGRLKNGTGAGYISLSIDGTTIFQLYYNETQIIINPPIKLSPNSVINITKDVTQDGYLHNGLYILKEKKE